MRRSVMDWILDDNNIDQAIKKVVSNDGAPGVDGMTVKAAGRYFREHKEEIKSLMRTGEYEVQPIRRVYIPKPNGGGQRPLGIPVALDRIAMQCVAQILSLGFERYFSDSSFGYRPNRDCHWAMAEAIDYLNDGYEWVIDLDISKFFDTVCHDKLISNIREKMNEEDVLKLIRNFLKAGVMEDGLVGPPNELGVPQGSPISPILSNIYLDKLDKELESRGLHFCRYADDVIIFVKSRKAANRVMISISNWIESNLFLKINREKSKVVKPDGASFLGFAFWNNKGVWEAKPLPDRKTRLKRKIKNVLRRKEAIGTKLGVKFTKVGQICRGWINYYSIGTMKSFMKDFGKWMRHRVRMIILMQWKRPRTIIDNLQKLNRRFKQGFTFEEIFMTANNRQGLFRKSCGRVLNYLISPKVLETPNEKTKRPGLINPLDYYMVRHARFR